MVLVVWVRRFSLCSLNLLLFLACLPVLRTVQPVRGLLGCQYRPVLSPLPSDGGITSCVIRNPGRAESSHAETRTPSAQRAQKSRQSITQSRQGSKQHEKRRRREISSSVRRVSLNTVDNRGATVLGPGEEDDDEEGEWAWCWMGGLWGFERPADRQAVSVSRRRQSKGRPLFFRPRLPHSFWQLILEITRSSPGALVPAVSVP